MAGQDNVANKFQGLPIAELISAPLTAVCDSQKKLAKSAFEFMTEIGFQTDKDGKPTQQARLLEFKLDRPVEGQGGTASVMVRAPFLGLIPLPALLIDDVQIDFQMEITDTATSKQTDNNETTVDVNSTFRFGCFAKGSVNVHGKVSSSRENTRSTNQTAKYQVHVSAHQQHPTEGLSKLMDILASCIEPLQLNA